MTQTAVLTPNAIGSLEFDLQVTPAANSIDSPDRLLLAVRQELLQVLDQVLDDAGNNHAPLRIAALTLDIGEFDSPVDWDLVRNTLRDRLVSAIRPYLTPQQPDTANAPFARQTQAQLRAMAAARGLPVSGRKSELVARLVAHAQRPWEHTAKALKRAQTDANLALILTGQENPSKSTARHIIGQMATPDIHNALRVVHGENIDISGDYSAQLLNAICDLESAEPRANPVITQTPLTRAHARYLVFMQDASTEDVEKIASKNEIYSHIISYLQSETQVNAAIEQRIPATATHLKKAVAALDMAPEPLAAKRHVLAALIAKKSIDINAAQAKTHDPAIAARAALTRGLSALGEDPAQAIDRPAPSDQTCKQMLVDTIGPSAQGLIAMVELIYSALLPALPSQSSSSVLFWGHLIETIVARNETQTVETVKNFIERLIPDPQKRDIALRATIARLNYPAVASATARAEARAVLENVLSPETAAARPAKQETPRSATQVAGLVLFHPYLAMLFDRLEIRRDSGKIVPQDLPVALAALARLALGDMRTTVASDPLFDCLLGRPNDGAPLPAKGLAPAGCALIDGLVQSVIAQWGRLGSTSADGLRAAFIQRGGLLDLDDPKQPKLTVNKGAYDMLLDGLPWSFNLIALPWMPAPLHIDWRQRDD
ncbi:SAP domain-containing protein [Yoonia tamlensis]|uniref:SAP domain-containing protein n=1 Tax=Yoonia tamlensis TaxID=390270 RepID=A0A1I6GC35_9RHOB|nr:contractile injection system tape measure protein [Yoonia tamlensis]SFR39701.1 SAP domain-containing protein [Yoonia tamlensis]